MTYADTSAERRRYGGPYAGKHKVPNIEEIMTKILKKNMTKPRDDVINLYIKEISKNDGAIMAALFDGGVNLYYRALRALREPPISDESDDMPDAGETEQAATANDERIDAAVTKTKKNLLLKAIKAMTFRDLAKMVKAAPKLAKLVPLGKPGQIVGNVLTDQQIKKALP